MPHPTSHAKPTTRDDVARMAGVSPAVVSYVVNGGPRAVSPANEAKVRQAIRALGYRPNAAARALALGSSEMLAMIVSDAMNPFFASLARAVENAAAERGYTLLLADSQASLRTERRLIKNFAARRVDGLFLCSMLFEPDLMDLEQADIPVVLLNHSTDLATAGSPAVMKHGAGGHGSNSVGVAFQDGARMAVEHLISHGHERIGLVMGGNAGGDLDAREVGWHQGIQDAGLTAGPIVRAPFTREGGLPCRTGAAGPQRAAHRRLRQLRPAGSGSALRPPRGRPAGTGGPRGVLLRRLARIRIHLAPAQHSRPTRKGPGADRRGSPPGPKPRRGNADQNLPHRAGTARFLRLPLTPTQPLRLR